jgi:hypothetical protein
MQVMRRGCNTMTCDSHVSQDETGLLLVFSLYWDFGDTAIRWFLVVHFPSTDYRHWTPSNWTPP